jgi:two-component system, cell cycle response regulator
MPIPSGEKKRVETGSEISGSQELAMDVKDIDRSKERVLAVDDDQRVAEVLSELLCALSFPCDTTFSGFDALKMLEKKEYSVVLVDMRMPEMSGFELIRKAREAHEDLSIVAMTGYADEFRYVDIINAGANDFVKKPIDTGELEAKLIRNISERNLRKELSRLSMTDSLTGLFNQREFYIRLKQEIVRSVRQKHPLGLILVDLDGFKEYNDSHGHVAGDAVLRSVGLAIGKSIREGVDTGFRYGGDEFAVILIDSDLSIAEEIGRRIKQAISEGGSIDASLGYAMYSDDMSLTDFVTAADSNLYRAKGRNGSLHQNRVPRR